MRRVRKSAHLSVLAQHLRGKLIGEDIEVMGVSGIDDVQSGEITWVENLRALKDAQKGSASALIISPSLYEKHSSEISKPCIVVQNPRYAYAKVLAFFYERDLPKSYISPKAIIGKGVEIGEDVYIGDYAVLEDGVLIGRGTVVYPLVFVGKNSSIGENSVLYPFVSVYSNTKIGDRVIIHSGAVIGADGFGFVKIEGGVNFKIPQVGRVEIGNDVEIGANTTIDRATTGVTYIGDGTKIDNLVQVGHNCEVGKNCIMVSHSGIAGSTILGDNVTMAAQAGTAPHIKIGSNTIVGGRGGVTHDIPSNSAVSGFPAKPHREALKIQAAVQRLPYTLKIIKQLEKRVEELEKKIGTSKEK